MFNFARFIMEEIDLVIVGAEGVAESGGVINKVIHFIKDYVATVKFMDSFRTRLFQRM